MKPREREVGSERKRERERVGNKERERQTARLRETEREDKSAVKIQRKKRKIPLGAEREHGGSGHLS